MAGERIEGTYILEARTPRGNTFEILRERSEMISGGKSATGTADSWEKIPFLPIRTAPDGKPFAPGTKIVFSVITDANKTIDSAVTFINIPLTQAESRITKTLSNNATDMNEQAIAAIALVAGVKTAVCIHRTDEGFGNFMIGGGKILLKLGVT